MKTFDFEFVTIRELVEKCKAVSVTLPSVGGPIQVCAHHAPLVALLRPGRVKIDKGDGSKKSLVVERGVLYVEDNKVTVLANRAVNSGDITKEALAEKSEELKDLIKQGTTGVEKEKLQSKLEFLQEQLKVSSQLSQEEG